MNTEIYFAINQMDFNIYLQECKAKEKVVLFVDRKNLSVTTTGGWA